MGRILERVQHGKKHFPNLVRQALGFIYQFRIPDSECASNFKLRLYFAV